jgi:hypothetical protein
MERDTARRNLASRLAPLERQREAVEGLIAAIDVMILHLQRRLAG